MTMTTSTSLTGVSKLNNLSHKSSLDVAGVPSDCAQAFTKAELKAIEVFVKTEAAGLKHERTAARPPMTMKYGGPTLQEGVLQHIRDAHELYIAKARKNGQVSLKEAKLIRKMFNVDIADANRIHGAEKATQIADEIRVYLQQQLLTPSKKTSKSVHMHAAAHEAIFGAGGPGQNQHCYYIIAPRPPVSG